MVKLPVARPLNRTGSSRSCTPLEATNYGELHFSVSVTLFKNSLPWLPVQAVTLGLGKLGLSRKPPCPSLFTVRLQPSTSQQSSPPCSSPVSGNMDHTVSGDTADHEHDPQTQTKPSEAVWTTDINMASDGSVGHINTVSDSGIDHGHPHSPQWQCGSQTSDINTDPDCHGLYYVILTEAIVI